MLYVIFQIILGSLACVAANEFQFFSRPELVVPRLNITVAADRNAVEKGLIFVAPYAGFSQGSYGPVQPGAYIFRDDGEVVWSGVGYHAGWVANFRPDNWNGKPYLRAFQGSLDAPHGRMYGFNTLLGNDYELVKKVRIGSHRLLSAHEFRLIKGKTALVENPIARPVPLRRWGGDDTQNWIVSGGFQGILSLPIFRNLQLTSAEIDIETGEVVFEWESFDHVDPKCKSGGDKVPRLRSCGSYKIQTALSH